MKHVKLLSLTLVALMLLTMLPVAVSAAEPGSLPVTDEKITLTIGVMANGVVTDWNTNEQTLYIEEVTGVDLEFIEYPQKEYVSKVNLMIAAGGEDLPDMLMGTVTSKSTLVSWGDTGLIIPLNEYYDSGLNYWMRKSIEEGCDVSYDEFVSMMTCYDGNIYGLPSYSESTNNQVSGNRILIYKPWLDKLGIAREDIVTTEDLYNVLCQFRDLDMNGNGDTTDEIPMLTESGYIVNLRQALMNAFVFNQRDYLIAEDGKVDVVFNRDEWRNGVKFVRKLVEEGLIMPESFTQDKAQMTALMTQEPEIVGVIARVSNSNMSTSDPKYGNWYYVSPLQGPEGVCENPYSPSIPNANLLITANCKHPEVAFMVGDYLCSEEMTIWGRFGRKDVEWHEPLEGELSAYADYGYETVVAIITKALSGDVNNYYYANSGPRIYGTKIFYGQADTSEGEIHNQVLGNAKDLLYARTFIDYDKAVVGLDYDEDQQDVFDSVYTPIVNYVNECWARFVLGDLDINDDAAWENFVSEVNGMGLEEALDSIQAAYDRK